MYYIYIYYISFALYSSSIFLAILHSIYSMCSFQRSFSSSITTRNLKICECSMVLSFIFIFVKGAEYFSFCSFYEKMSNLFCLHLLKKFLA